MHAALPINSSSSLFAPPPHAHEIVAAHEIDVPTLEFDLIGRNDIGNGIAILVERGVFACLAAGVLMKLSPFKSSQHCDTTKIERWLAGAIWGKSELVNS